MELKGEIKEIIFQNEINSYTIAVLGTEFEEITVVGYLPFITIGDSLKLDGKYQAELMEDFFKNKKENEGYDILSFELGENGDWIEKYIEVKSTKGSESTPIDITVWNFNFI